MNAKPIGHHKPHVGRNLLTSLQNHNVARDNQRTVQALAFTSAQHRGTRGEHLANCLHRLFRPALLDIADDGVGNYDRENNARVN